MSAAVMDHLCLPDEVQPKDNNRPSPLRISKEPPFGELQSTPAGAPLESPSATIALHDVRRHLTCQICSNLLASTLVLSCGHQYCGACLFDWLGNKPSCPSCQVPLRAIPMRCIAIDGVVEAFMSSVPEHDIASYKARQEEGKSAANKVNKMFWWLQPSATPGVPPGGGPAGYAPAANLGMGVPKPQHAPSPPMPSPGSMFGGGYVANPRALPPQGPLRRSSQPGYPQPQQSFHPRHNGRSNSFSAGGAPPIPHAHHQAPSSLPPQVAASIAAAGFSGSAMPVTGGGADLEAAYLATAQKFGMEGLALPLAYQQQMTMQQQYQQQQYQQQQDEQFRGLLHACSSDLQGMDISSRSGAAPFTDPAQLSQLLQGLYFA